MTASAPTLQTAAQLAATISVGVYDDDFDMIIDAIQRRRKEVGRLKAAELRPGDTAVITEGLRPKYIIGKTGTVVSVNRESVTLSFPQDASYGKFSGSRACRVPITCVEKAEA